ncbi:hypothetical protein COCNU_03G004960 [Cocos nucifera]|uniref:Uncharacterized protein n=1 Tax=Cocos nucifera TaxID=13894 RepID=A0A8K0MY25_COCNU|nr:hypothetical protein COCNU_03G004960 [Cocos nucifera]
MSPVADSLLFDTAMSHLLHLPETLEKLVFPSPRPEDGHGGAQGRAAGEVRGFGGVAVDILETPKEYTYLSQIARRSMICSFSPESISFLSLMTLTLEGSTSLQIIVDNVQ